MASQAPDHDMSHSGISGDLSGSPNFRTNSLGEILLFAAHEKKAKTWCRRARAGTVNHLQSQRFSVCCAWANNQFRKVVSLGKLAHSGR